MYVRLSFDGVFSPPFPQPQKRKTRPHLAAKPGRVLAQEWPTRPEAGGYRVAQRGRATHFLRPPRPAGGPRNLNRADRRELLTDSLQPATTPKKLHLLIVGAQHSCCFFLSRPKSDSGAGADRKLDFGGGRAGRSLLYPHSERRRALPSVGMRRLGRAGP